MLWGQRYSLKAVWIVLQQISSSNAWKYLSDRLEEKISKHIKEQNQKLYTTQGFLLIWAIERRLGVIEITIYDDRSMNNG